MERKISLPLYFAALVITVLIFAIGIYVGTLLDGVKSEQISKSLDRVSSSLSYYQLLMLSDNSSYFCPVYGDELSSLDKDTERIGSELTFLEDTQGYTDVELKKSYFILEAHSYLLSEKIRKECGGNYSLVLYFYSNTDCIGCKEQGENLIAAKRSVQPTRIYSFDGTLGSPIAETLMNKYNISAYPSVVIDGVRYEGLQGTERLISILRK